MPSLVEKVQVFGKGGHECITTPLLILRHGFPFRSIEGISIFDEDPGREPAGGLANRAAGRMME